MHTTYSAEPDDDVRPLDILKLHSKHELEGLINP
jgi:hypothetical protein